MINEKQEYVPTWILIVTAIFALLEIGVSIALCVAPESVVETVDLSGKGVSYLIYMWAARQFALGFIFAFAAFKKSPPMLTLAYIFFLVMMLGDLVIGVQQNENSMIIAALVMSVVAAAIIYFINKKNKDISQ